MLLFGKVSRCLFQSSNNPPIEFWKSSHWCLLVQFRGAESRGIVSYHVLERFGDHSVGSFVGCTWNIVFIIVQISAVISWFLSSMVALKIFVMYQLS
jgi:hypothetical protein